MPGEGKLELAFYPKDGGQPMKFNVFDFEGTGGVALAMYNTDAVCIYNVSTTFAKFILTIIF